MDFSALEELETSLLGLNDREPRMLSRAWCRKTAVRRLSLKSVRSAIAGMRFLHQTTSLIRGSVRNKEEGRIWPVHGLTMIGRARLRNIRQCVETILQGDVPGDLLEAGVWRGGAVIYMRALLKHYGDTKRSVWVADSFEGLPPPTDNPHDAHSIFHHFEYLSVPLDDVKKNFAAHGLLDERVQFLPGFFERSLRVAPIESLSLLRVDCDMYGSVRAVLDALYEKVSPGGFVIVDDYGSIVAARAATDEFRAQHGITEPMESIDHTGIFWRKQGTTKY